MRIELIDSILSDYKKELGKHFEKYRNHACRVYLLTCYLSKANELEQERLAVAAAFHDLGIWTANTFDYLDPSINLAKAYLIQNEQETWIEGITEIISQHHKLQSFQGNNLVENFRKADLIDLSFGFIKCGVPNEQIKKYNDLYPAKGFQLFILKKALQNFFKHPLNPLPMLKW